ncbi:TPA: hypothetical protein ACJHBZ_004893, partial [Escherichia coli]|uniref:hypothetical protein n=3 Tax=Escherichia coli TaxID=562 RepID=UPI001F4B3EB5
SVQSFPPFLLNIFHSMKDKTDTHLQFWVTNKKQCSPDIPPLAQFNPASKIDLFIVLIFVVRSG